MGINFIMSCCNSLFYLYYQSIILNFFCFNQRRLKISYRCNLWYKAFNWIFLSADQGIKGSKSFGRRHVSPTLFPSFSRRNNYVKFDFFFFLSVAFITPSYWEILWDLLFVGETTPIFIAWKRLPLLTMNYRYPRLRAYAISLGRKNERTKNGFLQYSQFFFFFSWLAKVEENMWGERCFKRNDEIHGERRMQNGSAFEGNDTSRDACDILNSRMPVIQPRN